METDSGKVLTRASPLRFHRCRRTPRVGRGTRARTYVSPADALHFEWRRWTQGAGSDSQTVDYPWAN